MIEPMAINTGPIVANGECMLELRENAGSWRLGHGHYMFNTERCFAKLNEPVASEEIHGPSFV